MSLICLIKAELKHLLIELLHITINFNGRLEISFIAFCLKVLEIVTSIIYNICISANSLDASKITHSGKTLEFALDDLPTLFYGLLLSCT